MRKANAILRVNAMKFTQFCAFCAFALLVRIHDAAAREWKDTSGSYKVEAYCVAVAENNIRLRKTDGSIVVVPLPKLSEVDRAYAKELETFDRAVQWIRKSQPAKAYETLKGSDHPLNSSLRGFLLGYDFKVDGFLLHDLGESKRLIETHSTWLETNRDDPRSDELLGTLSMYGVIVPQDLKKAVDCLSLASEHDRASARGRLALLYLLGKGVERSEAKGIELLESAANDGDVMSQFNLGVMYSNGAKVEKSSSKGLSWLRKASASGNPRAMAEWAAKLLDQSNDIEVAAQPPGERDLKAQRDYRALVDKKKKLFAQAAELAKRSHDMGCGEGTFALARITLHDPAQDANEKTAKVVPLWEEAANRNSVLGILSVAQVTRSEELKRTLKDQDRNWRDLLDQARSIDIFGQYSANIEEFAEKWRVEDLKRADAAADYQRRAKNAKLILLDWNWSSTASDTFVEANGRVKNVSTENLRNVTAVVSYFTEDGKFITSDEALISFNPILPGQTSTFRVIGQHNPAMKCASIELKSLLGGTIPWVREGGPE